MRPSFWEKMGFFLNFSCIVIEPGRLLRNGEADLGRGDVKLGVVEQATLQG
jgi:hypothetical protein